MRRKELTTEQVDRIIKLRERGLSWLAIEKETEKEKRIPRRLAQRVYTDWQRKTLSAEKKAIRQKATLEYFKEHVELIVAMGEQLNVLLNIWRLPVPLVDSEEYLAALWDRDLLLRTTEGIQPKVYGKEGTPLSDNRAVKQRNILIFRSLRDHTRETIHWEALEEWGAGWNGCREALKGISKELSTRYQKMIDKGDADLSKLIKPIWEEVKSDMADDVVMILWRLFVDSQSEADFITPMVALNARSLVDYLTGKGKPDIELPPRYESMLKSHSSEVMTDELKLVAGSVNIGHLFVCLQKMVGAYQELKEKLDPAVLRPLILGTRCVLCPV